MKVVEQPKTYLKIGETTRFTISFSPKTTMEYVGYVQIYNNDKDFSPYTFTIKGVGYASVIHVKHEDDYIPSVNGKFDFGEVRVGESSPKVTFTIENVGTEELTLDDSPKIQTSGANSAMFHIDQTMTTSPIAPEGTTTFSISFNPASVGSKSAEISISNNDPNYNPFTFTVLGLGTAPEINIKQGTTDIPSSSGKYDFGNVKVGENSTEIVFTIENTGTDDLNLNGSPKIQLSGTDTAMFYVSQAMTISPVAPGVQTTFRIYFCPKDAGIRTATISIPNNDTDENPYTFTISGTGLGSEINVKQGATDILSGTGSYDFGIVIIGNSSADVTFTIENLGYADLQLNGSSIIELSGTDASMFKLNQSMTSSSISPGNTTTFTITFTPTSLYRKTATISIANNDSDENPYTFTITGCCGDGQTEFDFNGDGLNDYVVGAPYDDDGGANSGCAFIFLGKSSPGSVIDASNADVKLIGEDAKDSFGLNVNCAGDINNDGFDDVIVGAWLDDDGGSTSGCAFIFYGSSNPPQSIDASNADVKLVGENGNDNFGYSVSCAGDVNNDGIDDVIIGGYCNNAGGHYSGSAYIFFGNPNMPMLIDASNADVKLIGENELHTFGRSVSNAGDFNNDGIDDVIVGANYASDNGNSSGNAYIFFGRTNFPNQVDASSANMKIFGENSADFFGTKVSNAGDINGDGFDDVIIGGYQPNSSSPGYASIFFGKSNPSSVVYASNADVKLVGVSAWDKFGCDVGFAGDVNGDGYDDVIVGACEDDDGGQESGCAFVFFGKSNMASTINASAADISLIGGDAQDQFGYSVYGLGDYNCDGYDDFIVSAYGDDDGGPDSGCVFVIFGDTSLIPKIDASKADIKIVGEDSGDGFGCSIGGGK